MQEGSRVALVHDFLVDVRGAERVFLALCDVFPQADLFTAVYDEQGTEGRFAHRAVHTSYLQRVRPNARTFRALLPLYPAAMQSLDLRGYDLVISSSSAWAHGVIPDEDAVRAFTELCLPLVVVGNGPAARRLHRLAGPTVSFTGRVSDAEAAHMLARARALVVTATEEFGIAAVEAQAAGRPVIALHEGGVRETVIEGETGLFFDTPEPEALIEAVLAFDALAVDPAACVASARRFDTAHFRRGVRAVVELALDGLGSRRAARRRPPRRARGLARPV